MGSLEPMVLLPKHVVSFRIQKRFKIKREGLGT